MANIHTIIDGRLVEAPRFFETKSDKTRLCSIRVADNPPKSNTKYKSSFVSFVLNETLSAIVEERGLDKGDLVAVSGELREREYEKKAGKGKKVKKGEKGVGLEIAYVSMFRITKCAADGQEKPEEPEDDAEETEDEETDDTAGETKSAFDDVD